MLTEKLMKLRASRQDIEAELFGLKDKRIKLLEVINKLEDEEMQLVSEVRGVAGGRCEEMQLQMSPIHLFSC
jgi:hypothetical protein